MSSSVRLKRLLNDAWQNDDLSSAQQAYYEYLDVNCLHPNKVRVVDSHTCLPRVIDTPCGKCFHCRTSKINEWCTRMYAHAEDFKHVYFVTLTYRSFDRHVTKVQQLALSKLQEAVWHLDSFNETKRYCYSPCLLVKKHYQDFIKRLRKNTGFTDITYVLCGELGKTYGRPHFHMILFTNNVITEQDVRKAWSFVMVRLQDGTIQFKRNQPGTVLHFPIGRVDFNDLVTNGTFNTDCKIRVDGTYMNAANCFAYVCKYVTKNQKANYARVYIAWANLFRARKYVNVYNNDFIYGMILRYIQDSGYTITKSQLNSISYEKLEFQPSQEIAQDDLQQFKNDSLFGHRYKRKKFDETYYTFRSVFSPFVECSRATPIGSVYATRHLQEFKEGVFNKPLLQDQGFVVPSYFRRKAANSLYGLRICRPTRTGRSFVFGALPLLLRHLQNCDESRLPPRWHDRSAKSSIMPLTCLQDPSKVLKDLSTGERILLTDGMAQYYKYDRHCREYVNTRGVPVADFVRLWLQDLQQEIERAKVALRLSKQDASARDASACILTDFGVDFTTFKNQYEENKKSERKAQDLLYHEQHTSVE